MKPVDPASGEDNLRPSQTQPASAAESFASESDSESDSETISSETIDSEASDKSEEQVVASSPESSVDPSSRSTTAQSGATSIPPFPTTASERLARQVAGPLENLQRRYTEQLSQDIGRLESEKAQLELDIAGLQSNYESLQKDVKSLREFEARTVSPSLGDSSQERPRPLKDLQASVTEPRLPGEPVSSTSPEKETADVPKVSMLKRLRKGLNNTDEESTEAQTTKSKSKASKVKAAEVKTTETKAAEVKAAEVEATEAKNVEDINVKAKTTEAKTPKTESVKAAPLLPGESVAPSAVSKASTTSVPSTELDSADQPVRPLELPIPATSEQRRQTSIQIRPPSDLVKLNLRKGVILSAIATILMAWHYSLIGTLGAGGTWLGFPVGELGAGFVPAVALLWLRMLVTVPALGALAPQLYKDTWDDIQDWVYTRDRLITLLIASGAALFISQVFIYQCVGVLGPVLGITLLFLYPLTASPLGALFAQERKMTPLGWLAMVAIAMGGVLAMRPFLASTANSGTSIWLGIIASVAFSLYIVLTNISYRQQCHPIPVGVVQFSTVAVLSSLVLLVKPLRLANISWIGFVVWGLLLGLTMLLVYLFTYSSLRMIGPRTGIVAAATPLVIALVAVGFAPFNSLEIIQWTGVGLVAIGGIALGKEKLGSRP